MSNMDYGGKENGGQQTSEAVWGPGEKQREPSLGNWPRRGRMDTRIKILNDVEPTSFVTSWIWEKKTQEVSGTTLRFLA